MSGSVIVNDQPLKLPSEMGLRALAHRWAPYRVPLSTSSESEFIELVDRRLKKDQSVSIAVSAVLDLERGHASYRSGCIGTFNYSLFCEATVDGSERIHFERLLSHRFGSDRGGADTDEREKITITSLLVAELQMQRLNSDLPNACTAVVTPLGPLTRDLRLKLHHDARNLDITDESIAAFFAEDSEL